MKRASKRKKNSVSSRWFGSASEHFWSIPTAFGQFQSLWRIKLWFQALRADSQWQKRFHEVRIELYCSTRFSPKEALPSSSKLTQDFPDEPQLGAPRVEPPPVDEPTVPASPHPPVGPFHSTAPDERTSPEIDITNVVDDVLDEFLREFLHHHRLEFQFGVGGRRSEETSISCV